MTPSGCCIPWYSTYTAPISVILLEKGLEFILSAVEICIARSFKVPKFSVNRFTFKFKYIFLSINWKYERKPSSMLSPVSISSHHESEESLYMGPSLLFWRPWMSVILRVHVQSYRISHRLAPSTLWLKGSYVFPSGPSTGWMSSVWRTDAMVMNNDPPLNHLPGHTLRGFKPEVSARNDK